jgi:hypothetical protein
VRVPLRRGRRSVLAAVVPVGLVLSAALTWSSTYAAFTSQAGSTGNSWQTGSVELESAGNGSALFTDTLDSNLRPLSSGSRCIRLEYTGSLTAEIKMYVTTPTSGATSLDSHLVMSVERGADENTTVPANCTGFTPRTTSPFVYNTVRAEYAVASSTSTMSDLKTHADYANGLLVSGSTAPNTSITLRISYLVKDAPEAQNSTSQAVFTWEAQNT